MRSNMIVIEGQRCFLRVLMELDVTPFTNMVARNMRYWSVHEPLHPPEYYTEKVQLKKIQESIQQMRLNREYSFGIFDIQTKEMVGHISLYSIKRMPFSSAFVGYSMDESHTGRGIVTEALSLVVKFAFNDLCLHRLEAYVSPKNIASVRVLEKAKFNREGLLRSLLYINGKWEDHYLYSYLEEDY